MKALIDTLFKLLDSGEKAYILLAILLSFICSPLIVGYAYWRKIRKRLQS